jgi:hypothetical protein
MVRFGFNIKTRTGQRVSNIFIMAGAQSDAERRLRQMYRDCEILTCKMLAVPRRRGALDVEDVITIINAGEPSTMKTSAANDARAPVIRLPNKAGTK